MRTCPSLVLILSLAACEHASNATSTSTLPEEAEPAEVMAEPAPEARPVAPPPPEAKTVAPGCERYRATRAAVKWREGCEPIRVTKKPTPAVDPAPAASPARATP